MSAEAVKPLGENKGVYLHNLGFSEVFLDDTKSKNIKRKNT